MSQALPSQSQSLEGDLMKPFLIFTSWQGIVSQHNDLMETTLTYCELLEKIDCNVGRPIIYRWTGTIWEVWNNEARTA